MMSFPDGLMVPIFWLCCFDALASQAPARASHACLASLSQSRRRAVQCAGQHMQNPEAGAAAPIGP
eukprot:6210805-Amphidinium_carterae.3